MSSLVIRSLLIIASIGFVMGGLPDWCDPHPPIPGATIRPSGPVREGNHVSIICNVPHANYGPKIFELFDFCINGRYRPGHTSCEVFNKPRK